ncbi:DinB family protein [Neobacillus drentensis]|uniref:DinB family protein n=1 Tax=Neobacillus drentensis TaxID=220684 RepID=UPI0030007B5A
MSKIENDNLNETRKRLVNEITFLSYDKFNYRNDINTWSIAQVCHHLVLVEKASAHAIAFGLNRINGNKKERKELQFVLDRTKKLEAPEIVYPDVVPFEVQQIIDLLNYSRVKLMAVLSTVEDTEILTEKSAKHPRYGELPLNQWIELLYLHEQRHIEQIKEIKILINGN